MAMLSNSSFPSTLTSTSSAGSESSFGMDRLLSNLLGGIGCGDTSPTTSAASSAVPDWRMPPSLPTSIPFKQQPLDWDFDRDFALFKQPSADNDPSKDFNFSDMLSTIGKRDEASLSNSPATTSSTVSVSCFKCEDRSTTARCLDCNEVYCHDCSSTPTFECRLREHSVVSVSRSSPEGSSANMQCDIHCEPIRFHCTTCAKVICQECTMWKHKEHMCVPVREAVENCKAKIYNSIESGKMGIKCIKNSIDKAVVISKSVEREAADVSMKIRKAMRHFILAIEDRERYLLEKVEKMRQMKLAELSDKTHGLRSALAGLAKTNVSLAKSVDLNGIDLLIAKDKADGQIEHFAVMYKSLQPRDESFIFVSPNFELLIDFKKQGDVISNSYNIQKHIPTSYSNLTPIVNSVPMLSDVGRTAKNPLSYVLNDPLSCYPSACTTPKLLGTRIVQKCKSQCIPGSILPVIAKPNRNVIPSMPIVSFGIDGHEEGQVSRPWGLCVDREGNIIVADRRNNRVQVFDYEGKFKLCFGRKGTEPGEFDLPAGISTDANGRIIVVDKDNHRVQIFTETGLFILKFGSFGKDCGQFQYPWDVAVSGAGDILITDSRNHRIQLFAPDGSFITKLSFDGVNHNRILKGLTTPRGACFTPQGDIIVSDFENHRLLLIDATLTKVLGSKGHEGSAVGEFSRPSGIVCDDEGRVIVADSKNQRVIVFSASLDFLWAVEVKGTGADEKDRPSDVALTLQGHLAVVVETLPDARDISSPGKMFVQIF